MKIKFYNWIYAILTFIPLIVANIEYTALPNTIPIHFNAYGQPDRFGNRIDIFTFPIFMINKKKQL